MSLRKRQGRNERAFQRPAGWGPCGGWGQGKAAAAPWGALQLDTGTLELGLETGEFRKPCILKLRSPSSDLLPERQPGDGHRGQKQCPEAEKMRQ